MRKEIEDAFSIAREEGEPLVAFLRRRAAVLRAAGAMPEEENLTVQRIRAILRNTGGGGESGEGSGSD